MMTAGGMGGEAVVYDLVYLDYSVSSTFSGEVGRQG